jgi:hypothetical protein
LNIKIKPILLKNREKRSENSTGFTTIKTQN